MESLFSELGSLAGVILIDIALSADNAVAVGLAAAALPDHQRQRAVAWGVVLALALRIVFGLLTVELLRVHGILLVGGFVLFWVAWRMWSDLSAHVAAEEAARERGAETEAAAAKEPTFAHALVSIVVANIALSLDNVLAVAGLARNTPVIMSFGLVLSVVLMGVAASWIASVIEKHTWIGRLGVAVIVFAGALMIWDDISSFFPNFVPPPPEWLGGHAAHI